MCILITYIPIVGISWNFWIPSLIIFENRNLDFGGHNRKISKIIGGHFVQRCFTPFRVYRLRRTSKLNILAAFKHLPFFDQKWPNMASLKHHFLENYLSDFFLKFCWQTSKWCLGRYWKFLVDIYRRFWAIEKIRQGDAGSAPPPQRGACSWASERIERCEFLRGLVEQFKYERPGPTRHGTARHGTARHGTARHDTTRPHDAFDELNSLQPRVRLTNDLLWWVATSLLPSMEPTPILLGSCTVASGTCKVGGCKNWPLMYNPGVEIR